MVFDFQDISILFFVSSVSVMTPGDLHAISSFQTIQDKYDPKPVVIVLEVTDMEKLGAIINDPKNQEAKDRHTVKDPIISIHVDM
jgi:hypothetical protein